MIQSKEYSNEVQVTKLCGALTTRLTPAQVLSKLTTKKAVGSLENCHWGLNLVEKFKLSVTPSNVKCKTRKLSYTYTKGEKRKKMKNLNLASCCRINNIIKRKVNLIQSNKYSNEVQ